MYMKQYLHMYMYGTSTCTVHVSHVSPCTPAFLSTEVRCTVCTEHVSSLNLGVGVAVDKDAAGEVLYVFPVDVVCMVRQGKGDEMI